MSLGIAVLGASGRMGRLVLTSILESSDLRLTVAITDSTCDQRGVDAATLVGKAPCGIVLQTLGEASLQSTDVLVDFSAPEALQHVLPLMGARALVTGTTGLPAEAQAALEQHAHQAAVLQAANFSTGVNLLLELARQAAAALPDYEIEIVETHHKHKRDAPSGTALALGRACTDGRSQSLAEVAKHGREGIDPRTSPAEIGFHALRCGDVVGEHQVWLSGPGERIQLFHNATERSTFAQGALRAARFLAQQPPGLYTMAQVLGL